MDLFMMPEGQESQVRMKTIAKYIVYGCVLFIAGDRNFQNENLIS